MGGPRGSRPVIAGRRGRCAEEGDDPDAWARAVSGGAGRARLQAEQGERATRDAGLGRHGLARWIRMEGFGCWAELVLVWVGFLIYFFSFFYSNSNKV